MKKKKTKKRKKKQNKVSSNQKTKNSPFLFFLSNIQKSIQFTVDVFTQFRDPRRFVEPHRTNPMPTHLHSSGTINIYVVQIK